MTSLIIARLTLDEEPLLEDEHVPDKCKIMSWCCLYVYMCMPYYGSAIFTSSSSVALLDDRILANIIGSGGKGGAVCGAGVVITSVPLSGSVVGVGGSGVLVGGPGVVVREASNTATVSVSGSVTVESSDEEEPSTVDLTAEVDTVC